MNTQNIPSVMREYVLCTCMAISPSEKAPAIEPISNRRTESNIAMAENVPLIAAK